MQNIWEVYFLCVVQLNGLRKAMQKMLSSHSLTEALQQRVADYSLEIRSVLQLMTHQIHF